MTWKNNGSFPNWSSLHSSTIHLKWDTYVCDKKFVNEELLCTLFKISWVEYYPENCLYFLTL